MTRRWRRAATDAGRLITAPVRVLPDFVIIGAQRSGTTSLYELLGQHPQVRPARQKEVHFFDAPPRHLLHYRASFPVGPRSAERRSWRTGEATPSLLYHPGAPARMAAALPRARFVAILRDPVDRAYSHWALAQARGRESLDFAAALEAESERLASEDEITADGGLSLLHRRVSYVRRGEYVDQVARWLDAVGRDRLFVVQSERLFRDPAATADIQRWLGLAEVPAPFPHHNATQSAPMDPAVRHRLEAHFRPYNERLFALLGETYEWSGG
jgi:hypothetical protein